MKLLNFIVFSSLCLTISCSFNRGQYFFSEGGIQGTSYHITYQSPDNINFQDSIAQLLQKFDLSLSSYNPNSILSRINRNESNVNVDKYFTDVFKKSVDINKISDGMFDITVGPLVNAWGFGPERKKHIDSLVIDSLLQFVGMYKVKLENNHINKANPGIKIDVNAIAQGYSCDVVAAFLEGKGCHNYLVEIGGEIRAKGKNPNNETWRVGIDKPIDNNLVPGQELQVVVKLKNRSMATSGNYRRFYIENGTKVVHHISPKTGYPVTSNLLSVTTVADDCITADALGTACICSGLEKSKEIIKKLGNVDAYLIYTDEKGKYQVYMTEGMKDMIASELGPTNQE
jgi:FAD:protein FMN transferase